MSEKNALKSVSWRSLLKPTTAIRNFPKGIGRHCSWILLTDFQVKQQIVNPIVHGGSEVALKHGVGVSFPPPSPS